MLQAKATHDPSSADHPSFLPDPIKPRREVALPQYFQLLDTQMKRFRQSIKRLHHPGAPVNAPDGDRYRRFSASHDKLVSTMWLLEKLANPRELRLLHQYARETLADIFGQSPFWEKIIQRGYANYEVMEYLYGKENGGMSSIGALIHRYAMDSGTARAIVNRKNATLRCIQRLHARIRKPLRIMSIGCGPAEDSWDLLKTHRHIVKELVLNDWDDGALNFVRRRFRAEISSGQVRIVKGNVLNIVRHKGAGGINVDGVFDVISALGVIDYFGDATLKAFIARLYRYLSPEGILITANLAPHLVHKSSIEFIGQWYMKYRSLEKMRTVALQAAIPGNRIEVFPDDLGVVEMAVLHKADSRPPHATRRRKAPGRKFKVMLIQPARLSGDGQAVLRGANKFAPGLTLPLLTSLFRADADIEVIPVFEDEEYIPYDLDIDLVGITCMTHQATRAYQIARRFKTRGVPVLMGGIHVSAVPKEAQRHCDAVVIGEAEDIINEIIRDARDGRLKPEYRGAQPESLDELPVPAFEITRNYHYRVPDFYSIETSRGCPFACEFCCVSPYFGRKQRYKSIARVTAEIRAIKSLSNSTQWTFFTDDNFFFNKTRVSELLAALAPEKIKWFAQSNVAIGKDPAFLKQAYDSGCRMLYLGVESLNKNALGQKKNINRPKDYREWLKNISNAGIVPLVSIIFGMDGDDASVFQETAQTLIEWNVPTAIFFTLAPIPGSPLAKRLQTEERLLPSARQWHRFTGDAAHFKPSHLSVEELNAGIWTAYEIFYAQTQVMNRTAKWEGNDCYDWITFFNGIAYDAVNRRIHPMM